MLNILISYSGGGVGLGSYTLFAQTQTVTSTSTSEVSLAGTGVGSIVLPANLLTSGKVISFIISGFYSCPSGAAPDPLLTIKLKLSGTTIASNSAPASVIFATASLGGWRIVGEIVCRSTGISGTIMLNPILLLVPNSPDFSNFFPVILPMVNTVPVVVDTTVPQTFDITVQWGSAHDSQSISLTDLILVSL